MATALGAANARWTEADWREVLADSALGDWAEIQHRKTGARKQRNPGDSEKRLAHTWKKATRRVIERPPAVDHYGVHAELAALVATADENPATWRGAGGVTDRAVLAALVDIASAACTITPSASTRQLAEAANISPSTAGVSLRRLCRDAWLRPERPARGTEAATWRLVRREAVPKPVEDVEKVLEDLQDSHTRRVAPKSTRGHDAFCHGGLGRVAARIFDVLEDGAQGGLTVRQITALTGLHKRTVGRHLVSLQAVDLAASGARGRTWARSLAAGDPDQLREALDDAAAQLGTTGTTAARIVRHAAQRETWSTWWTDFSARRGWAVQRGRYRPDQPMLPLARAA
jgi:DNA-binding transcriptional ArsR family regulator